MTIDERIEALTMSLELLSHDNEARRAEDQARRAEDRERSAEEQARNAEITSQISALMQIAHLHIESLAAHLKRVETLEARR